MLFKEKKLVKKVKVVDTTPPEVSTDFTSIDIVKGTDLTKYDFNSLNLFKISDLSPTELEYDYSAIDANTEGTYVLKANVKDSSGNLTTKESSVNITKAPEQNQELVTETITNNEGKKITRNTLKNKETTQEKVVQSSSQTHSHSVSKPQKQNTSSNNSITSTQTQPVSQSFVANMSISRQTTQAITVVGNGGNYATLTVHTKRNGVWTETLRCSARVGKNGITGNKREGDGKTPRGIYSLGQAFGLAGNPGTSRRNSAEHLISYPTAYRYAIAVNYNTACTRGAGSAIFLHCSTGRATAGCISVSQNDMVRILKMLQGDTLIGIYQNKNSLY